MPTDSTHELIRLVQQTVDAARETADELCRARAENERFLQAIQERDALIREYIETIQTLRLEAVQRGTGS